VSLYELLTARSFHGKTIEMLVQKIQNQIDSASSARSGLPKSGLHRPARVAKKPEQRYPSWPSSPRTLEVVQQTLPPGSFPTARSTSL